MANWVIIFSWHEQDSREGKEQRWRGTRQIVLVFEGQCAAHSLPGTKKDGPAWWGVGSGGGPARTEPCEHFRVGENTKF